MLFEQKEALMDATLSGKWGKGGARIGREIRATRSERQTSSHKCSVQCELMNTAAEACEALVDALSKEERCE